jgi:hypothetical protein
VDLWRERAVAALIGGMFAMFVAALVTWCTP